jgi:hypothetical protein
MAEEYVGLTVFDDRGTALEALRLLLLHDSQLDEHDLLPPRSTTLTGRLSKEEWSRR